MCRIEMEPGDVALPPRETLTEAQRDASAFPTHTGMSNRQRLEQMNSRLPEAERLDLRSLPLCDPFGDIPWVKGW